ncbi:E3 ubiquitin-protein ligase RNF31 isoform X2 [Denticeps clupeoides]|uniref:E3 ubiquitin-protein ligase RNF31 isoform X2 n=1 Tax=Denticeps clupeoides TaxID=299321 RepID=UPI0010A376D0|nr:E3 ubiquitin-protein ligase RNF31-like isoform X2 [Denticeps clupeoides]
MATLMAQLEEVRSRAEMSLSSSSSAQEVRTGVTAMANLALPLSSKYCHIAAENMVKENSTGNNRKETIGSMQRLSTALNILEKYGSNLTNSNRPKYWRTVKHNNPVFRATVDSIQGGRAVLCLYGYTNQQADGLSFPEEVQEPDVEKVASITLEVMSLRMELDMLIQGSHPHPEFFERLISSLSPQEEESNAVPFTTSERAWEKEPQSLSNPKSLSTTLASNKPAGCSLCAATATLLCIPCGSFRFCDSCDVAFHRHPSRATHKRDPLSAQRLDNCTICGIFPVSAQCPVCVQRLCSECDRLYHSHPARANHSRISVASTIPAKSISASLSSWQCVHCTTVNRMQDVLCGTCERPRLASAAPSSATPHEEPPQSSIISEWQCKSCTVVNSASSVLCEVCERPRLATRPPVTPSRPAAPVLGQRDSQICDLTRAEPGPPPTSLKTPSPIKEVSTPLSDKPKATHTDDLDLKRQKLMKEEGLKLIQLIREGEKNGVSPEEVYAGIHVTGNRNALPCDWLKTELPALLDEICLRAASSPHGPKVHCLEGSLEYGGQEAQKSGGVHLSRAEAKQAWLTAGGNSEKAVIQALRDRQAKVKELSVLGFTDSARCGEALRQGGGEVRGALALLQRPLLEPFHQRMWSDQPEPPIDIHHPDKQRLCRRLLAVYDLPSWGRSELALSLLQDPTAPYTLEDVVQAVRESHDRDFIRRVLAKECPICLSVFPHSKMQSLTSCQCSVCCDCFQQHFTIAIRDKHIRDMVCPVCWEPDINDPEHLNSYFSTLDIQLRDCLEPEVYELFHKKLTEQALIKDPKFLWCSHCSYGFIYDGDQLKVTCFQCRNSFCALCKKPWESQHAGLSCEQFQLWKRENDPEYQKQGLAGYLRDNGITCPNCRFQYALARGGCMHFCCSQCRYQFCSGCNNPFHTTCSVIQCSVTGLHAHHPRDCLFYLRDWEPARLQALLQKEGVPFNTEPPHGTQAGLCGVIEQKDEGTHQTDSACGAQTRPGQAGLCEKHYIEYLVSLINGHSIDPSPLFNANELVLACRRYQVEEPRSEADDDRTYYSRLLKKLMEHVPLGDKVPRKK